MAKLKQNYIFNSEKDEKKIIDINDDEIINPKSLSDYLNKVTDEIIKLNNENHSLKNNLSNISLKVELNNKQNNDNKLMNEKLKKTIENYANELENKIAILNQINIEKNQIENLIKKVDNDRQYMMTVLLRLCKILPNSNISILINEMMNNSNLNINQKERINIQILNEIKNCENYIKELKENEINNYNEKNNININNRNKVESNNLINNTGESIDNIYFKKNIYNSELKIGDIYKYK